MTAFECTGLSVDIAMEIEIGQLKKIELFELSQKSTFYICLTELT